MSEQVSMRRQSELVYRKSLVQGAAKKIILSVHSGNTENGVLTAAIKRVNIPMSRRWSVRLSVWWSDMRLDDMKCTMSPDASIISLCAKLYEPRNSGVAACDAVYSPTGR